MSEGAWKLRPRRWERRFRRVRTRAAVAVVVRAGDRGPEVLLMVRAARAGDPWSGHVSCPGGFIEPSDRDARAAAIRETREEVGLDLTMARPVGRLSTQLSWTPRHGGRFLAITPVVLEWSGTTALQLSEEAASAFWVPLATLRDPAVATVRPWQVLGIRLDMPAWRVGDAVIWGLTHRILSELLVRLARC